jgi:hypothetical protein
MRLRRTPTIPIMSRTPPINWILNTEPVAVIAHLRMAPVAINMMFNISPTALSVLIDPSNAAGVWAKA